MKNINFKQILTFILIVVTLILITFNSSEKNPNEVTITGKITNPKSDSVTFIIGGFTPLDTSLTTYSTNTDKLGNFKISFNVDTASYVGFYHGIEQTSMYVYPKDKIKLSIDTERFDETIKYKGSKSSNYLAAKSLFFEKNDPYGEKYILSSSAEYISFKDSIIISVFDILKGITDTLFIKNEVNAIKKELNNAVIQQEKLAELSWDRRNYMFKTRDFWRIFNFNASIDSLSFSDFKKMTEEYTDTCQALLKDNTDDDFIKEETEKLKKVADDWLERKNAVDNKPNIGDSALDFNYPDINGKELSLSDFKGNLIYVDVWATWCGPCKREIPYLKILENEYKGKKITFMSISVDEEKEAWIKMVNDKKLGGVQLWADGFSKITKDYAIFSIPRFMLFDKEGNIISTDAPRPSSEIIRELFNNNL